MGSDLPPTKIYAGIDEAGYGPMFGPLLVARAVFQIKSDCDDPLPDHLDLWHILRHAVCKQLSKRQGRIAVNDSKKLHTKASGISHLERGVLAFASLNHQRPTCVCSLLDRLGTTCHRDLSALPWYQPTDEAPWQTLPDRCEQSDLNVSSAMLATVARKAGVDVPDLGAAVVFEDRFNKMVAATRSKASTSFTFVAAHLQAIWKKFAANHPIVVVDRQSGRTRYRELLALTFPSAQIRVVEESSSASAYELQSGRGHMTVRFEVNADANHMPVALASMTAKYIRELMMQRFNHYFTTRAPELKPTAGYATDGKRFWDDLQPLLPTLQIDTTHLKRSS